MSKYRVMVVEDEPLLLKYIAQKIEACSDLYRVTAAFGDADTALQAMRSDVPDVVFTDIRMPGMSGLELLRHIRESYPNLPTVLLTAYADFEYAQEAVRQQAFDYLLKPLNMSELSAVLTRLQSVLQSDAKPAEAETGQPSEGMSAEQTFELIRDYLQANYAGRINLNSLSERFKYSPEHLIKLFKRYANTTPIRYLTELRINAACRLLSEGRLSVSSVGKQVGYDDIFYFSKLFKQHRGVSPAAYKAALDGDRK